MFTCLIVRAREREMDQTTSVREAAAHIVCFHMLLLLLENFISIEGMLFYRVYAIPSLMGRNVRASPLSHCHTPSLSLSFPQAAHTSGYDSIKKCNQVHHSNEFPPEFNRWMPNLSIICVLVLSCSAFMRHICDSKHSWAEQLLFIWIPFGPPHKCVPQSAKSNTNVFCIFILKFQWRPFCFDSLLATIVNVNGNVATF